jgi:adenine-specific DNA-methyltransferase
MPTLQFKGKNVIWNHHLSVPYHTLEEDLKLGFQAKKGDGTSTSLSAGNLIIEGDNLLALKSLLPQYAGKVKCIYIDPPYNIGNEGWVYNDNVNSPLIKEWLGKEVGKDDLTRHDKWLCMMTPRIKLLRELISDDGVIFISIDDNEQYSLRSIMNEIFGEENFISEFVWEGALKNDSRFVSISHDYIITYAKNIDNLKVNDSHWRTRKEGIDEIYKKVEDLKKKLGNDFEKISNGLKEWFKIIGKNHISWQHRHYNKVDMEGVYFPSDISWPGGGGPKYSVVHPKTKRPVRIPMRGWVYPNFDRMLEAITENRVEFGEDENKVPTLKRYLHKTESQVLPSVFYKDRRAAMQRLRDVLGDDRFENPKDEEVLSKLIEAVTIESSIVLDSFAGSGTTMHAVMDLNKEDGGNRKCILVQMTEATEKEPKKNVCRDITRERVKRAIEKYGYDSGFKYIRVGDPIDPESMLSGVLPTYKQFAKYVYYLCTGVTLSDETEISEKTYFVGTFKKSAIYLVYRQDYDTLTKLALNLPLAEGIVKEHPGHKLIIYAPACFLDEEYLQAQNIEYVGIPYNLFRRQA